VSGLEVQFNILNYEVAVSQLQNKVNSLTPETDKLPAIASQAITLQAYRSRLDIVGELLQSYRRLLEKDLVALRDARESLTETDRSLAGSASSLLGQ
jgi:hypothetical protein